MWDKNQFLPYFHVFMVDSAPEGHMHTSPELRRARQAGMMAEVLTAPMLVDHAHTGHEVLLVSHGTGQAVVGANADEFPLSAGQILIIPGGHQHRLEASEHLCVYGFEFSPGFFEALSDDPLGKRLASPADPPPARLFHDPSALKSFQNLFEEVLVARGQSDAFDGLVFHAYGHLIAVAMLRLLRQESEFSSEHPTVLRVLTTKTWIDRHLFEPVSLDELAQMANLSPSRYCTIFRKLVGMSPKHYRLTRRLQHATRLLSESSYSLSTIARMVGFSDLASFHHAFKQASGVSPSAFRKRGARE